ncbi:recombinase family protein [Brucella sp. TWI559]
MNRFENTTSLSPIANNANATKRVAIYGRYSSSLQNKASIDDQFRLIREYAEKQPDWVIVREYEDAALSGSSFVTRPGIRQLMADAQRGEFDIIVAESLDRFTRDQADVATLHKRMRYMGIQIFTLSEKEISEIHIGLQGTMNALYLKELSDKTRRGLRGCIEAGRSAGGRCYGYQAVEKLHSDGSPIRGLLEIHPIEAVVVRRIFTEFAEGRSPRAIARRLNTHNIAGPHGRPWNDTTIRGHKKRGTGILNNELYIGRRIWNRLRYQKDLDTGRRVSRLNPRENWVIRNEPNLRIVENTLWHAAQQRHDEISTAHVHITAAVQSYHSYNRLSGMRRPVSLLSGRVFCAQCGGHYSLRSSKRFVCSNHIGKGSCDNGRTIQRDALESMVLSGMKNHLADAAMISIAQRAFSSAQRQFEEDAVSGNTGLKPQLVQTQKEIAALLNAIKAGMFHESMKAELDRLECAKANLERRLSASPNHRRSVSIDLDKSFHDKLNDLTRCLNQREDIHVAGEIIRSLIDKIVIHPHALRGHMEIRVTGSIAAIFKKTESPDDTI